MKKIILIIALATMSLAMWAQTSADSMGFGATSYFTFFSFETTIDVTLDQEVEGSYSAVQCDIVLPKWLTVSADANGAPEVQLNSERVTDHTAAATITEGDDVNTMRVIVSSASNSLIQGTTGNIFSFNVKQTRSAESQRVKLTNAVASTIEYGVIKRVEMPDASALLTYQRTKQGDLNGDGNVNAGDISELYTAILSGKSDLKYDLNGDGNVNAGDISELYDIIIGSKE